MLDIAFVAAVLEGIEGTLDELVGRVERSDLRGRLTSLQDETAAVRNLFEASPQPAPRATNRRPPGAHVEH